KNIALKFKKREFNEMPDYLLVIFGIPAFLISSYWMFVITEVTPDFIRAVNKQAHIDILGISIAGILLVLAAEVWFFSSIAVRCHTILYERWFK
ncbi:hypothetical protein, partial [Acinetobacter oleivorans]|uniref:hypothetical protein n=2 Tax=Moraxellaceae TaxID=468 RepID=UPI0020C60C16